MSRFEPEKGIVQSLEGKVVVVTGIPTPDLLSRNDSVAAPSRLNFMVPQR